MLQKKHRLQNGTLNDEERTDILLTEIAMDVNDEAYEASEQEGEDEGITI